MPGRVTSIMVKLGDEVSVGTPLLILEAMKMQNEVVSHKSGQWLQLECGREQPSKRILCFSKSVRVMN
jgi:biotin carboxyl carrier protein